VLAYISIKTIAYYRKSTKPINGRTEAESILYQKFSVEEHAKRYNKEIIKEYSDVAYSGTTVERPDLQRMLEDLRSGNVKAKELLMYSVDRFGRDLRENINTFTEIMKYVDVITFVDTGLSTTTESFRMYFLLQTGAAQQQRENLLKNLALGRRSKTLVTKAFTGT
jgi:site-specific DNA recombinase